MTAVKIMLPEDVERKVSELAESQHITIEELMTMALMEKLSTIRDPYLEERAKLGQREDFDAFLAQVPDVPPDDYDKLE